MTTLPGTSTGQQSTGTPTVLTAGDRQQFHGVDRLWVGHQLDQFRDRGDRQLRLSAGAEQELFEQFRPGFRAAGRTAPRAM